jgi:hypothetical protein
MPFHHCTICQDDGSVVVKDVTLVLEEGPGDDPASWHATITVTHLIPLVSGQRYRLVLDDGRAGEFRVRRNTFAGEMNRAVAIEGAGPLQ